MKRIGLFGLVVVFSAGLSFAEVSVLAEDNFSNPNPGWVLCGPAGHKAVVSGEALKLTVSDITTFSTTGYLPFEVIALKDGQTLRLSVDVATDYSERRGQDVRAGLGFSASGLRTSEKFKVGVSGYYLSLPSGGQPGAAVCKWHDGNKKANDFLYVSTTTLGDLSNKGIVSDQLIPLVFEIKRVGSTLQFSGSLNGKPFGKQVSARDPELPENFQFNVVALGYCYAKGHTASYDNLKVELMTP
jgi:hypothetical protein